MLHGTAHPTGILTRHLKPAQPTSANRQATLPNDAAQWTSLAVVVMIHDVHIITPSGRAEMLARADLPLRSPNRSYLPSRTMLLGLVLLVCSQLPLIASIGLSTAGDALMAHGDFLGARDVFALATSLSSFESEYCLVRGAQCEVMSGDLYRASELAFQAAVNRPNTILGQLCGDVLASATSHQSPRWRKLVVRRATWKCYVRAAPMQYLDWAVWMANLRKLGAAGITDDLASAMRLREQRLE